VCLPWADAFCQTVDLNGLLALSAQGKGAGKGDIHLFVDSRESELVQQSPNQSKPGKKMNALFSRRIAVAHDAAFCFYYQDNLDLLAQACGELFRFRP